MNIYTILGLAAFAFVIIWRIFRACKTGFAKELDNTISIIFAVFIGFYIYKTANGFVEERYGRVIAFIALIAAILLIYKIVNLIMTAFKLFAKLPAVRVIDKFLGLFLGALEGVVIDMALIEVLQFVF